MKIKIQKRKFIRNIIIGIVALLIVAGIINTAPGYKRNKYKDVTNLIIGDENVTEKLQNQIYHDEKGIIYIAKEDIKNLIDKTIYYDEQTNRIIATSEVAVASMKINEKIINIDGTDKHTLNSVIIKDNIIYIPIEEMEEVYNIEVNYIEDTDTVIIDKLNKGMIKAQAIKTTKIKYKPRGLSKNVGELKEGEVVNAYYTTSKGWRLIRTKQGIIGYIKADTLTNEYIIRQDMHQETETKTINLRVKDGETYTIEDKKVKIKDMFKITEEGILLKNSISINNEADEIWANITIENIDLSQYNKRTELVKNIATLSRKNNIDGINVILTDNQYIERFIIELAPKLNEIGIITNIIKTQDINEENYIDIVSYIIEE